MQKREIMWIAALLGLIGAYYHFFAGRSGERQIIIHASLRPGRRAEAPVWPVYFTLNDAFQLTSVKVVPLDDDGQVNPATMPVWNLVTESNSAPVRAFFYGQHISGMKPALANVKPDVLTPGVIYQIQITAGKLTAVTPFKTVATRE